VRSQIVLYSENNTFSLQRGLEAYRKICRNLKFEREFVLAEGRLKAKLTQVLPEYFQVAHELVALLKLQFSSFCHAIGLWIIVFTIRHFEFSLLTVLHSK
jgi:hypothetical protein